MFFKKFLIMQLENQILLKNDDIEMYSTHNEGKSIVAEIFIRTLKNKIYKRMTAALKICKLINWMI